MSLSVLSTNTRATAAYTSAGFALEGTLPEAAFIGGQWVDVVAMAALNPARTGVLISPWDRGHLARMLVQRPQLRGIIFTLATNLCFTSSA